MDYPVKRGNDYFFQFSLKIRKEAVKLQDVNLITTAHEQRKHAT